MEPRIRGALAWRIFLISLVLIFVPFILHALFLWEKDSRLQVLNALNQIEDVGVATQDMIDAREEDLKEMFAHFREAKELPRGFYRFPLPLTGEEPFPAQVLQKGADGEYLYIQEKGEVIFFAAVGDELWGKKTKEEKWIPKGLSPFVIVLDEPPVPKHRDEVILSMKELTLRREKSGLFQMTDLFGKTLTLADPVANSNFFLVVEVNPKALSALIGRDILTYVLSFLLILTVVGGLITLWLVWRMSRPYKQLGHVMSEVEKGNLSVRFKRDRFGFEINALGNHFNQMLSHLLENIEAARELQIGRDIQQTLFPRELSKESSINVGTGFQPAREVGGDFYDVLPLRSGEILFVIADGSDKGVSACLYALIVRSLIRGLVTSQETLQDAIERINSLFCKDTRETGNFVTAWIGVYNLEKKSLSYANLGHPYPLLLDGQGGVSELEGEGIALGATPKIEVEVHSRQIDPGTFLLLYTDGILDAVNEKGELFGKSRLLSFCRLEKEKAAQGVIDQLIAEVSLFAGDAQQADDLTFLALEFL